MQYFRVKNFIACFKPLLSIIAVARLKIFPPNRNSWLRFYGYVQYGIFKYTVQ